MLSSPPIQIVPTLLICEVEWDGSWMPATPTDAHMIYRDAPKRCAACKTPVMTAGNYTQVAKATMRHIGLHGRCSVK